MMMPSPVFIVGVHRSGTTLLRYMLNSHPNLYIPPESDFIPRFFQDQPTTPMSPQTAVCILRTIFDEYRFVREWRAPHPDAEDFVASLPDLRPATFLDALYQQYAHQYDAQRWGDKTPIYTSYMDLIAQLFPRAQFIHIIRDGRDVALSMVEKWGAQEFHIDLYFAARSWRKRLCQAARVVPSLDPGRYLELRYRNLVAQPDVVLRQVCTFIGEDYVDAMAHPHLRARQDIAPDGFHAPIHQPPNTKHVDRWRTEMSIKDQRLFQAVAGSKLEQLGYETVDLGKMPFAETMRFAGLKAKYFILQQARTILEYIGFFHPN